MPKHDIALFCKSYAGDIKRFKKLLSSIEQYNTDRLPFFVSVPNADLNVFRPLLSNISFVILLSDEDLLNESNALGNAKSSDYSGSLLQQIVKVAFGMIGKASCYVVIDSDSFFIRPFSKGDFSMDDGFPITVMHECEDLLEFSEQNKMHFVKTNYQRERKKLQRLFNRTGNIYDFGPTPVVWGSEVWEKLKDDYLRKNNISLGALISKYPSELLLYGEALLEYKTFPIYARKPLFKVFHYKEQFEALEDAQRSSVNLAGKYLGIVMQSNWYKINKKLSPTNRLYLFLKNMRRKK